MKLITFGLDGCLINIIKENMSKLEINGKFKEDFTEWLNEAEMNYNAPTFYQFEYWKYDFQIQFMMKFLNNIPYGNSYYVEDYRVYSIDQMNELIEKYNNAE